MMMEGPNFKVLDFENAIQQLNRTLELYLSGQIYYIIFDLETSISLEPWRGEIIMFSWAHALDNIGYSVPLFVNNRIDHELKDLPYEIKICTAGFCVTGCLCGKSTDQR